MPLDEEKRVKDQLQVSKIESVSCGIWECFVKYADYIKDQFETTVSKEALLTPRVKFEAHFQCKQKHVRDVLPISCLHSYRRQKTLVLIY